MSRHKLVRDKSTEERAAFWAAVKEAAEEVATWPAWRRAGININRKNFETYEGKSNEESQDHVQETGKREGSG